ncbi:UPF0058 family protein [Halolamina sp.]|jgi:Predicted metal-binding protein|uniref:UPF0058 family protein n=1 Tax=Halolamina sp. TaxID=1940283 RepID=UPI000223B7A1|nr:protein of unknown function UPF0058 [halophilic archaeon DL31]
MKKQELIHLHGLLAEVRGAYDDSEELDCSKYEAFGVQPTSIHRSKTDHKTAVFKLAGGLTTSFEAEQVTQAAD